MAKCVSCKQEILWLKTNEGKSMLVNVCGKDGMPIPFTDTLFDFKKHVSHFATCDDPKRFRRGNMNQQFECVRCQHFGDESRFVLRVLSIMYRPKSDTVQAFKMLKCPVCRETVSIIFESLECKNYV